MFFKHYNYGGESGIRTHDRKFYTRFPSVRLKPLGHLSCTPYKSNLKNSSISIYQIYAQKNFQLLWLYF